MAGRCNPRRLATLQRLRDRAHDQDDWIRASEWSADAFRAVEAELEEPGAQYEVKDCR